MSALPRTIIPASPRSTWDDLRMAGTDPDRTVRARARRGIVLVIAAMLTLVTVSACGTSATSHSHATVASLMPAAYATDRQPGYVFAMTFSVNGAGQHASFTASGSFDAHTRQGTILENIAGHRLAGVFKRPYLYLRAPRPSAATGGKPWIRVDLAVESPSLGQGAATGASDPVATLNYIRQTGQVGVVGPATVNGLSTTRYHAFVDLDRVTATAAPALRPAYRRQAQLFKRLTGATTFPLDVWVDRHGLVRRLSFHILICTRAGRFSVSTTLQIMRYGPQPPVRVPPPSRFIDVTSRARAQNSAAAQAAC